MNTTPYYAVIFTSLRTDVEEGYTEMAQQMAELAAQQPGYLGIESARNELGITISYWVHWRVSKTGKRKAIIYWLRNLDVRNGIAITKQEYAKWRESMNLVRCK